MKTKAPSIYYERHLWRRGLRHIAGIDEVGRGALAGPVVAAAVVIAPAIKLPGVRDSKQLNPRQRQEAEKIIKQNVIAWAIGQASVEEITQVNIYHATHLAMRRAIDNISVHVHAALIDGLPATLKPNMPTHNIIKGDQKSLSIAAASIIAKVYRDQLMEELSQHYPHYGFAQHKGYPTLLHKAALRQWGITPHHRRTYAPVRAVSRAPSDRVLRADFEAFSAWSPSESEG